MPAPKEPGYSCPHIDSAIEEMENARKIHNSLREWGHYWKDRCDEIERDLSKEIDSLKDDVRQWEDRCETLEDEIADLRRALAQAEAEIKDLAAHAQR
jgi:predicted  nucleic acid-binding Zn-ribbon protein